MKSMAEGRVEVGSSPWPWTGIAPIVATNRGLRPTSAGGMLPRQRLCFLIARRGFAYRRESVAPQFIAMALLRAAGLAIEQLLELLLKLGALHCGRFTRMFLQVAKDHREIPRINP